MGFDVVLYNREGDKLKILELSEELHSEIFNSKKIWRSYSELRKLSDYYLTDETFSGNRLSSLITDLNNYKYLLPRNNLEEYEVFISEITRSDIGKVHIAGD
ncbi:hypothetical protein QUF86_10260 [Peribacillus sp. NJ11]|uniref:hypothetical protein n=1 Tax=Peribacillus sp. NJ11 TaxID=3055861 RepID=UPI0025A204A9|nr:hypothetical protein [Peribacillus sp. NJ11]MDM5221099.1 hypothetical protein [Peribacillus sp. NJ11]